MFVDTKEPETSGTELKSKNPLAQALEEFLGTLSDEDKGKIWENITRWKSVKKD